MSQKSTHIRTLPLFFGVVYVLEAYGHAPGLASKITPIVKRFSIFCLKNWRRAKKIGRSVCLNGLAGPVLIVCTTTEVRPKSVGDAANASMFSFIAYTSSFRTCSGIGRVDTRKSASKTSKNSEVFLSVVHISRSVLLYQLQVVLYKVRVVLYQIRVLCCSGSSHRPQIGLPRCSDRFCDCFCDASGFDRRTIAVPKLQPIGLPKTFCILRSFRFRTKAFSDCSSSKRVINDDLRARPRRSVLRVKGSVKL